MFSNSAVFIVVVVFFGITNADVVKSGKCPTNIQVISDFNIEKYMGHWHEYAKYPNMFELGGKCNTAMYSLKADGRVRVNNSMVNEETGVLEDIIGYATHVETGKLKIVFPITQRYSPSSNYWVLDTDYISYSVVYACNQMMNKFTTFVWILTREIDPPMKFVETPLDILKRNKISLEPLRPTLQVGCSDSP